MLDDVSEVEACQMLTTKGEIESLRLATRKELGPTHVAGTEPITDKPSQPHHKVSVPYLKVTIFVGTNSLVPRPIPRFSMLHAEKQEGLVCKITCVTRSQRNATSPKGRLWKLPILSYRI